MSFIKNINLSDHLTSYTGTVYRIIESQSKNSTRKLVDSDEEQILLEEMIEKIKPKIPLGPEKFHYLIYTPFRYPPLRHGSRFGATNEMSLFYAGLSKEVTLAERSYYYFCFLEDSQAKFSPNTIDHTLFSVEISSHLAIDRTEGILNKYKNKISNPASHKESQHLGRKARQICDAIIYCSARHRGNLKNIAIFNHRPFKYKQVHQKNMEAWSIILSSTSVSCRDTFSGNQLEFSKEYFNIDKKFFNIVTAHT